MKNVTIGIFVLLCAQLRLDADDEKFLVEKQEGIEWRAAEGATGGRLSVTTTDLPPEVQSITGAFGIAPGKLEFSGTTLSGGTSPKKVTIAVSVKMPQMPLLVQRMGEDRIMVIDFERNSQTGSFPIMVEKGATGTLKIRDEEIDIARLRPPLLGPCGMVKGTGTSELGIGVYTHSGNGRGYTGDAGGTFLVPHKEADFYELTGPYDCAKLPFRINVPTESGSPEHAQIIPTMIWFPHDFKVDEQQSDMNFKDLPKGSVFVGAAVNQ